MTTFLQHIIASAAAVPDVNSIQTGTVDIASSSASVTDTITAVTKAKSFLVFQYESADTGDNPQNNFVRGTITNSTTLTFTRANNPAVAITIRWWVVEFTAGSSTTVQHGTRTITGTTDNVTITALTLANSFPLVTWSSAHAGSPGTDDHLTAELTTTTNLQFRRVGTQTLIADWQVIENANWTVTKYTDSMITTDTTEDTPVTAVTLADVWLVGYEEPQSVVAAPGGDSFLRWQFTSTTNIQATRATTVSYNSNLLYHVIDGGGLFAAQHFQSEVIGAAASSNTTALSPNIDTAKSIIKNNCGFPSYSTKSSIDDDGRNTCVKHQINSASEVQQERVNNPTPTAITDFDVIDFTGSF